VYFIGIILLFLINNNNIKVINSLKAVFIINLEKTIEKGKITLNRYLYSILYLGEWSMRSSKPWVALYSLFFNQRTTTPQFTPKIELTTLYTFNIGCKISSYKNCGY
jgi:hypothetical protein